MAHLSNRLRRILIGAGFLLVSWTVFLFLLFASPWPVPLVANILMLVLLTGYNFSRKTGAILFLCTPFATGFAIFFGIAVTDYLAGRPALHYSGLTEHELFDSTSRMPWVNTDDDDDFGQLEPALAVPHNLALRIMYHLFGPAPGAYTGYIPDTHAATSLLNALPRTASPSIGDLPLRIRGDSLLLPDSIYFDLRSTGYLSDLFQVKARIVDANLMLIGFFRDDTVRRALGYDSRNGRLMLEYRCTDDILLNCAVLDDSTLQLVCGATIKFMDGRSADSIRSCDNTSAFALLRPGDYTLRVQAPGYSSSYYEQLHLDSIDIPIVQFHPVLLHHALTSDEKMQTVDGR
ncbi:MAG: carboxypeptidase-like regulatory domain-containing protein [Candidatus Kapaibacterium sp.]